MSNLTVFKKFKSKAEYFGAIVTKHPKTVVVSFPSRGENREVYEIVQRDGYWEVGDRQMATKSACYDYLTDKLMAQFERDPC